MKNKTKKVLFFVGAFLMMPIFASATVIFEDNFDNCSSSCMASSINAPSGWSQWHGFYSAIHDGITHYSGEITSPGMGGLGKSLKTWRHSVDWEGYAGSLVYYFPNEYNEIYMRYYMKLPTSLDLSHCLDSNYLKMWRLNTTTASPNHEIYLNINQNGGSTRETGELNMYTYNTGWRELLSNAELREIWDGNWHSLEFHINMSTGLAELWVDGVRRYTENDWIFGSGSFQMMQHFTLGNHASGCAWQDSWQALEVDNFALSTSYIGSVGGEESDTTAPSTPTGLSVQ